MGRSNVNSALTKSGDLHEQPIVSEKTAIQGLSRTKTALYGLANLPTSIVGLPIALYIPAFRVKQDVTPGVDNMMWFTGQLNGTYDILCAEYCGQMHSYMLTTITVMDRSDYDIWLVTEPDTSNEPPGLTLLKKNACLSCHTQDGSKLVGPSFKGIVGMKETVIIDGKDTEIIVDRDYISESIKHPNAAIVKGYQSGLMISYELTISDEEIDHIIDYIETLK